jgi:hypothetical protein
MKKWIFILSIVLGISSLSVSGYIDSQIKAGQQELSSAKQKMQTYGKVSSKVPLSQPLNKQITKQADAEMAQGQMKISYYQSVSFVLKITGFILFLVAVIITLREYLRRKR